jgi:uncharacterized membrane protein
VFDRAVRWTMTGHSAGRKTYELREITQEKPVIKAAMKPMLTANSGYVMVIDDGEIVRIATERFSTLALVRAVEELSEVLGMRLRKEANPR